MEKGNWDAINMNLQNVLGEIFYDYDLQSLSCYERRKVIFDFLCNNLSYDYEMLNNIRNFREGRASVSRNPVLELSSVVHDRIGICNGISQYYKLLLEEVGIASYCVICDDGTSVRHQLNLVYDKDKSTYSFDDVTSVIVGRGTVEDYFDYDLVVANSFKQGNVEIMPGKKWFILPEGYINCLAGREKSSFQTLENLPDNITSVKTQIGSKKI